MDIDLDINRESGPFADYGAVWTDTLRRTVGDIHLACDPAEAGPNLPAPNNGDIARDAAGYLWRYANRWTPATDENLVPLSHADGPHPAELVPPLSLVIRAREEPAERI